MLKLLLLSAVGLAAVQVNAQTGNPEAAVGQTFNKPTKAWKQWQPKPTYAYTNLPDQYLGTTGEPDENGWVPPQTGYNRCLQGEGAWNANASCQTAWVNSVDDFCVWGPPKAGSEVGVYERDAVAYCTKPTHGTRLIPDGTLTGVHFVITKDYLQVTGQGDFTNIGLPANDTGGEMDPHGEDDRSNPIGGVVYTTARPGREGKNTFIREWTNFMSATQFCFRVCWGEQEKAQCQHIYDVMGCTWNIPANYGPGFESCEGDIAEFQGIYDGSTFRQGDAVTPDPHPAPPSSNCQTTSTIGNGGVLLASSLQSAATSAPTGTGNNGTNGTGSSTTRFSTGTGASRPVSTSGSGSGSGSTNGTTNSNTSGAATPFAAVSALLVATVVGGVALLTVL